MAGEDLATTRLREELPPETRNRRKFAGFVGSFVVVSFILSPSKKIRDNTRQATRGPRPES